MQPNDFALIVAAARKEAEKLLKTADRSALQSFAPVFEIRDRNLWMVHGGVTADLGTVVAQKGDLGPRGVDGNNGRDGIDGKAGLDGANGRNGIDGADGKDGADEFVQLCTRHIGTVGVSGTVVHRITPVYGWE